MQAVLISAFTAALVTLLMEFAAKPHLEARKDRILDTHRARRGLVSKIDLIMWPAPPVMDVSRYPSPTGESGVEIMGNFLSKMEDVRIDFVRVSPYLRVRQQKVAKRFAGDLTSKLMVMTGVLHMYKKAHPSEPKVAAALEGQMTNLTKSVVADILALRAILLALPSNPWQYFKTLRGLAKVNLYVDRSRQPKNAEHVQGQEGEH